MTIYTYMEKHKEEDRSLSLSLALNLARTTIFSAYLQCHVLVSVTGGLNGVYI